MGSLLFVAILIYGLWKIFAASSVLLFHRGEPDDKVAMIPLRGLDVWERPMAPVGYLRALARAKRRKWVVISGYCLFVLLAQPFETLGPALIGLGITYAVMMALDLVTMAVLRRA